MADAGVFVVIVTRLLWRRPYPFRIPSIAQTIVMDAALYVLLLCTSRIAFVFMAIFGTVCTTLVLRSI